ARPRQCRRQRPRAGRRRARPDPRRDGAADRRERRRRQPRRNLPRELTGGRMAKPPLRIAIAGLGTVGAGAVRLLRRNAELLAQRGGRELVIAAVSARDRGRDRGIELAGPRWFADAAALAADPAIDIVVELIGGADGIARSVVETALAH